MPTDLPPDPLAEAALTPSEREVWEETRQDLARAKKKIHTLESRLSLLENKIDETHVADAILTRPEFNREVARMLAFDERYGGTSSVLYFDIENLTDLQAAHGVEPVNRMLRAIIDTLLKEVRRSDILGRLAHDEFGVLLARCSNADAWKKAESVASRICEAVKDIQGLTTPPQINYGAYTFRDQASPQNTLHQAAKNTTLA